MTTSRVLLPPTVDPPSSSYSLLVTSDPALVRAAQRLRHQVFADELGATLDSTVPGHDVDRFDLFCDHLLVRTGDGAVVGTYRLLTPERARRAGGLYADAEFDLGPLAPLRSQLVEIGRSCVHPDHRTGAVIALMWSGLLRYQLLSGRRWLGGCVSVPLDDTGAAAAAVWRHVRAGHLAPEGHRVQPWVAWDPADAPHVLRPVLPPLLRGYLRLGARVCGPPAHDAGFGCADFFTLLDAESIDRRYLRHLVGDIR